VGFSEDGSGELPLENAREAGRFGMS